MEGIRGENILKGAEGQQDGPRKNWDRRQNKEYGLGKRRKTVEGN